MYCIWARLLLLLLVACFLETGVQPRPSPGEPNCSVISTYPDHPLRTATLAAPAIKGLLIDKPLPSSIW